MLTVTQPEIHGRKECDPTLQSLSKRAKKQRACAPDKSTSSCSQQTSDIPEGPHT